MLTQDKTKTISIITFLVIIIFASHIHCAEVDTVSVHSESMNKNIPAVVITPGSYQNQGHEFPVVYLLHGYSDNYSKWVNTVPKIKELADLYRMIIVCPDGGYSSWYFDSPVDDSYHYETHIAKELVTYIDNNYNTIKKRTGRAITGLSMGGHGALYLAIRNLDLFGAAGSQSGGVDIRPFPNNWHLAKRLGTYTDFPENWENNTVINMVEQVQPGSLAITFECGVDDFFYEVNKELHKKLLKLNIPHNYTVRPGKHNWEYWKNSIQYQLLFFCNYFSQNN